MGETAPMVSARSALAGLGSPSSIGANRSNEPLTWPIAEAAIGWRVSWILGPKRGAMTPGETLPKLADIWNSASPLTLGLSGIPRGKGPQGMVPASEAQKSAASVLVVEDEVLIRLEIAEELRAYGFLVVEAATADQALSYFQAGVQVDLVLSDIELPGTLNGVDLIRRLRAEAPNLPTVLTSGHTPSVHEADAFLPKPYDLRQAVALVATLLQKEAR